MLAKIYSGTTIGLDGVLIEVEVDVASRGFPAFNIVGLPSKAVDEAKERVRAAITNIDYQMPDTRITINLAPADIPKNGSGFDLPIAIGILVASGVISQDAISRSLFIGEVSLKGEVRRVTGILSLSIMAKKYNLNKIYLSSENAQEASLVDDLEIYSINNITDLVLHLTGHKLISKYVNNISLNLQRDTSLFEYKFEDIRGQESAKRALLISASGNHNVLLKGPPGSGKTMLSKAFVSILPSLSKPEIIEVTKIHSIVGLLEKNGLIINRPFRSPHHTISRIGLIGGGSTPTPGEISLAHRGILFLDELPEFPRAVLEALRQPLEDGRVTISRALGTLTFPSKFLLLAALNSCPCGYLGHPTKPCRCTPGTILRYKKRLSGPLLDRIDIYIDVPPVSSDKISNDSFIETSEIISNKVLRARTIQKQRFKEINILTNSEMSPKNIKNFCKLTISAQELLKKAILKYSLSARGYFKTIKISQTISDLDNLNLIDEAQIAEALQYRSTND